MFSHPVRALALLSAPAVMATPAQQAPWAAWRTIATAHYRIHYPPALGDWAQDVAGRIEAIHARVTDQVGYQSPRPVQVVLEDPVAESNGLAVPILPAPHVILWRTEPGSDSQIGGAMSSWTEELLAHELTHIHHLMRPRLARPPGPVESLFALPLGPLLLKCPRWISEGYATLLEGRITGSGRPHSALRAAVLRQWARAGKLPPYRTLDRSRDFLGGDMAYLVGSAYLEWLERQRPDQPDLLQRLWKQLAGLNHRSFEAGFAATLGFTAQEGYQRFQAETTHDALEWETRIKAQGLREGTLWLRVPGAVADLAVSPGGGKLLARLQTRRDPGLRVWSLAPAPAARPAPAAADPFNAVADAPPEFPPPERLASLPSLNHQPPRDAGWIDDGTVQFQLNRSDPEGILRPRPGLWRLPGGVDLDPPGPVAPPGPTLAPVHRHGRWVLELDGQAVPLPGQAAGRAWVDRDRRQLFAGCEIDGIWNLVRVPWLDQGGRRRFAAPQRLTRTVSAAWNPAPTPDGRWLYFTSLDARGMEIRKLDLALPPLEDQPAPEPRLLDPATVIPARPDPGALPDPEPVPAATPYRAADNLWNHLAAGASLTPSGNSWQIGLAGSDLLGRLSWQVLAGLGDGAGPRGAVAGVSSAAWRWRPSLTLFSALERPSLQRFDPAPADRSRQGGEFTLTYDHLGDTRFWLSPVAAWERVRPVAATGPDHPFNRGLAGLRAGLGALWARGPWGLALTPALEGYAGSSLTPGAAPGWNAARVQLAARLENPWLALTLRAEGGSFHGNPNETFHLGGVTSGLVPESLDLDRVEQPALPADTATGNRFTRWRAELGGTVRVYGEGTALWSSGQERGPTQRVVGVAFDLDRGQRPGSDQALGKVKVQVGLHRPLDGAMKDRTVATLTLRFRP